MNHNDNCPLLRETIRNALSCSYKCRATSSMIMNIIRITLFLILLVPAMVTMHGGSSEGPNVLLCIHMQVAVTNPARPEQSWVQGLAVQRRVKKQRRNHLVYVPVVVVSTGPEVDSHWYSDLAVRGRSRKPHEIYLKLY